MASVILFIGAVGIVAIFLFFAFRKQHPKTIPSMAGQRKILDKHVSFFKDLSDVEKTHFCNRVNDFLHEKTITGIKVDIDDMDRVFVAAAAIIPIFYFPDWKYRNINEILLYPTSFSRDFMLEGEGRNIAGMVGTGPMQNVMILSRTALREGFLSSGGTFNPAIHEFVHLIDKSDGATDGVPEVLLRHGYSLPWIRRIREEIRKIEQLKSDVNPYGAISDAEFFAVAAEYFFNQPAQMKDKNPGLYKMLQEIFGHEEKEN